MMEKALFHDFQMFFIVFDHANAYASMHLLVEIQNNKIGVNKKCLIPTLSLFYMDLKIIAIEKKEQILVSG